MFCVDSCEWIEYFSKGPLADKYAAWIAKAKPSSCLVPAIVFFEVYKKIKREQGQDAAEYAVAAMLSCSTPVELDDGTAVLAADFALSKKLGLADAIILATISQRNALLITSDKHFKGMSGIEFIE